MSEGAILHYRIVRPLGAGGMGVVFLAEEVTLVLAGRANEARAAAATAESLATSDGGTFLLARYWALTGNRERSLVQLERALGLRVSHPDLVRDPAFQRWTGDRRFERVRAAMRERFRAGSA
jgi:hypothetical protein